MNSLLLNRKFCFNILKNLKFYSTTKDSDLTPSSTNVPEETPRNINKEIQIPRSKYAGKIRVPAIDDEKDVVQTLKNTFNHFKSLKDDRDVPQECDVFIVGGGIIGTLTAVWLKSISTHYNIIIVERDIDYTQSSTFWSVGGFRQQFSLVENIQMSMYGSHYIRNIKDHLDMEKKFKFDLTENVDVRFNHDGYLFLASDRTVDRMVDNHRVQLSQGAKVKLFNPDELKQAFKWINTDGIQLGSFGYENEGWIDPKKFLMAARAKAISMGVHYIHGEVVEFDTDKSLSNIGPFNRIDRALVDTFDNRIVPIRFPLIVNAAGPFAGDVARLAGIGVEYDSKDSPEFSLRTALPVEKRKRYIYMIQAEKGPLLNVPLTIDSSGVFFRRHNLSNVYLCGLNQDEASEPKNLDLNEIDYDYFHERIKPVLLKRVPSFENMKLLGAWAGYYEYNTFDQNLIIGKHHIHQNFLFANGSSGHGLQHAPAISRALSELIAYGSYRTIDLRRFGFDRVVSNTPLREIDVV